MSGQPQVIVTLKSDSGKLQMELPGVNGYRRKIEIKDPPSFRELYDLVDRARAIAVDERMQEILNTIIGHAAALYDNAPLETLRRILQAQATGEVEIGRDGAPTVAQVSHWENHRIWPNDTCAFCRAEGRSTSALSRKLKPSEQLDFQILALDKSGAEDWAHRALLPKSVPPLEKRQGDKRAETWRDRAKARLLQLRLKEAGIAAERRKLYPGASTRTNSSHDPKAKRSISPSEILFTLD